MPDTIIMPYKQRLEGQVVTLKRKSLDIELLEIHA